MLRIFNPALRRMSQVNRWGIVNTINDQTIGEHSFYVTVYSYEIGKELRYVNMEGLLVCAMFHELDEIVTGDIPGPVKKGSGIDEQIKEWVIKELKSHDLDLGIYPTIEMKAIIRVADLIDEAAFIKKELNMGNKSLVQLYGYVQAKLAEAIMRLPGDAYNVGVLRNKIFQFLVDMNKPTVFIYNV